jgi:reactive intermediate/imine deaminase
VLPRENGWANVACCSTRKAISTDTAPAALGPYSQAIVAGSLVFCSGTVGINPATGVPGDGVEAQTELALRNLDAILAAAGTSLSALVKTTIFYTNVEDFAEELGRDRQREMLARAERQRVARQFHVRSRTAKSVERPRRRLRRALRVVFS